MRCDFWRIGFGIKNLSLLEKGSNHFRAEQRAEVFFVEEELARLTERSIIDFGNVMKIEY